MKDSNDSVDDLDAMETDPFFVLGISLSATDNEIQQQFHKKMQEGGNHDQLINAYAKIRTQSSRTKYRWGSMFSYLTDPFEGQQVSQQTSIDVASLIKELAFLSSWEAEAGQ